MLTPQLSLILNQLEQVLIHDINAPCGDRKLVSDLEKAQELLMYTKQNQVDSVVYKLNKLGSITAQDFLDRFKKATSPLKPAVVHPPQIQVKAVTAEVVDDSPMTEDETLKLSACENLIEKGLACMGETVTAIKQIRDERLYRKSYGSFNDYCTERWKRSSRRIYQLIGAREIAEGLAKSSEAMIQPTRESQLRELKKIGSSEVKQAEAWDKAVETAGGQQPTAKEVSVAVKAVKHQTVSAGPCGSMATEDLTARQKRVTNDLLFQLQGVLMFNDDVAFFRRLKSDIIVAVNRRLIELRCAL